MEMTRYMLREKNLPKKVWAETANTAVFLQNRLPTKAVKERHHLRHASVTSLIGELHRDEEWNLDDAEKKCQTLEKLKFKFFDSSIEEEDDWQSEIVDDASVRGTRLLSHIYERCNVAVCESANYAEAKKDQSPKDVRSKVKEIKSILLKKALYGLKQAPRAWYSKIDEHLLSLGFVKSLSETNLYVKHNDLGLMSYFLGIEIKQGQGEVFIYKKKKYAKEILKKFKMDECKAEFNWLHDMYLTATKPNILNVVSILSRFMHCASELHLKTAKRVIRYVKGTSDFGVKFTRGKEYFKLIGFSNNDWGGSVDDMRSTSGYCFTLGSGIFSWSSKKQEIVAQSTTEAEFIAAIATANQALWPREILLDLNLEQKESTEILVDNKAAIAISHNPMFYKKTRYFHIKLFFLR
ncbi:retrovirus-related Pol polyprotein from transposon TNT 1-94 [Cucumis melo var. makuwa]|uniref:Retrovirus-related Pol polyprotein from transposon TNT 1-94 n=1 Tax=Cucumis melo var. makuwa TaxID=1194695 RepID=A0A5A7TBA6_CUCMM|nr:retrovirus-related Pol polyprotein from transposon TNT 1-94 [Cucumis melo var. makuwa]TYK00499.1 retrovirus-related Pol polyprotein from transposon TNT 1-94 [Cucumis melo var. makuwa]